LKEDSTWELVDGLQRISTLLEFMGELRDPTTHDLKPPIALVATKYLPSLDKIVKEKNITKADLLLYQLRLSIIDALGQKGETGEASDGMDVSVAIFDKEQISG